MLFSKYKTRNDSICLNNDSIRICYSQLSNYLIKPGILKIVEII
jgi:hypothetical protein